jgi:hypothetical protein
MANRIVQNRGIRIASLLALLAGVSALPIRSSRPVGVTAYPRFNRDKLASPETASPRITATSVGSQPVLFKALPAENDEELDRTTGPVWCGLEQSPAVTFKPEWILATSGFDPEFHPLRC